MAVNESMSDSGPVIERFKLESTRRNLTVERVQRVSPRMMRVVLRGDELAGFSSPSPDDHVKLFFPGPEGFLQGRDYTPRRFDSAARLLTIDFALHEGGVGSSWAEKARPGNPLVVGGPRGSKVVTAPDAWWLLVGDATAVPSIGRRLEEMAARTRVFTVIGVNGPEEEQRFETKAELTAHWVHRSEGEAADPAPILLAISKLTLPQGPGFIWIGTESSVSRAVRTHAIERMGHSPEWLKASAYWSQGDETPE